MLEATTDQSKKSQYADLLGKITKQSQWIFAGKVFFIVVGFATVALLARILGPSLLGRYQLGLTVIQIATIFSVAGFDRGLVRFLPILPKENNSEARALFALNIQISLALSVALATVLYFAAPLLSGYYFHSEEMAEVLRVFIVYLPVLSVFKIASGAVIGVKRADMGSNVSNVLSPVVFLILLLLILSSGGELVSCIFARSTTDLIAAVALTCFLLKKLPKSDQTPERSFSLRGFLSFSTDVMVLGMIYFLLGHMDIIMLGYFVVDSEVGIYSVALRVAICVIFGLQIVLPIIRPHFSELSERGDFKTIEALFKTVTKWLLYSGLFVFGLILVLRFEILNVFGAEFVSGGSILLILGIGHLANVISGPTGQILVMTGKQRWEMTNSILMVVLNFFLNLFLIPRMGTIGAAIATALSISTINAAKFIEVFLIYNIHPYSLKFIKGIFAVFCGCVSCYLVRWIAIELAMGYVSVIVLAGSSFMAITFAVMWILGFDEEDRMLFAIVQRR